MSLDFKDVSSVPAAPDGKQQHVVETLDTVDVGTSSLLAAQVRCDFTMATALEAVAQTVQLYGLPEAITIDRDHRFVGTNTARLPLAVSALLVVPGCAGHGLSTAPARSQYVCNT